MIRYSSDNQKLAKKIDVQAPKWRQRARKRTAELIRAGSYDGKAPFWSQIKSVYVGLQNDKCVYCESKLKGAKRALIDYDVEHFRPKNSVQPWPNVGQKYSFKTGSSLANGYYWLAYDILNYAAACKPCNTPLKKNYFPVRGKRGKAPESVAKLRTERPFLCYPIGTLDEDPEDLITFQGTIAVPKAIKGTYEHDRARVIIDFFELNDTELLHEQRAQMIVALAVMLDKSEKLPRPNLYRKAIDRLLSGEMAHTSCLRAFSSLWKEKPAEAAKVVKKCVARIGSAST